MATALLTALVAAPANAAGDRVIARDSHVCRIFAFRGTIVYARGTSAGLYCRLSGKRPAMRILNGRRYPAHGLPRNAQLGLFTEPIGLDAAGRVVVPFSTSGSGHQRWWTYDVAADTARRVNLRVPTRCSIDALALWRSRIAYIRVCAPGSRPSGFFLRIGTHERRLARFVAQGAGLVMLGTTVAGAVGDDGDEISVGSLSAHDRWCGSRPNYGEMFAGIWLSPGRMTWLIYAPTYGDPQAPRFGKAVLRTATTDGQCRPVGGTTRRYDIPQIRDADALTVDAPYLYYATESAIHRHPLSGL